MSLNLERVHSFSFPPVVALALTRSDGPCRRAPESNRAIVELQPLGSWSFGQQNGIFKWRSHSRRKALSRRPPWLFHLAALNWNSGASIHPALGGELPTRPWIRPPISARADRDPLPQKSGPRRRLEIVGNSVACHPPPSAFTRSTLASICLRRMSAALR